MPHRTILLEFTPGVFYIGASGILKILHRNEMSLGAHTHAHSQAPSLENYSICTQVTDAVAEYF